MRIHRETVNSAQIASTLLIAFIFTTGVGRGQSKPEFSIEISPSHDGYVVGVPIFKVGTPVNVIIRIHNDSKHGLQYDLKPGPLIYRVKVLDSNGKQVPESDYLRYLKTPEGRRDIDTDGPSVKIEPGSYCLDSKLISGYWDMTKPGKYTIQLERDFPPELGTGVAKSNVIEISVEA
jgi:hypothetical protein